MNPDRALSTLRCAPTRRLALLLLLGVFAVGAGVSARQEATPDGPAGRLVVLNKSADTAMILDLPGGELLATLPTGVGPHEVAVAPDGKLAVVSNYGRNVPGNSLTILDLVKNEVVRTLVLGEELRPHGLAFEPDGKALWVTVEEERQLWKLSFPEGEVLARIDTQQATSHMVALAGDGRAFVTNIVPGTVTPVDRAAGVAGEPFKTGSGAEGVAVTADGKRVWVANRGEDTISILEAATQDELQKLPCEGFPIRVYCTTDGSKMLVTCAYGGALSVFDAATGKPLGQVAMEMQPSADVEGRLFADFGERPIPIGAAVDSTGRYAFVANAGADKVAVVDLEALLVIAGLDTGKEPDGIAWFPVPEQQ